jgi:predicted metal-dependent hydrolase
VDEIELPGDPTIAIRLRRSAAARRYSLRVSRLDGRVTLTMPRRGSRREALSFARDKAAWIRQHLAERPGEVQALPGARIPIAGQMRLLEQGPVRRLRLEPDRLVLPAGRAGSPPAIAAFLRELARDRLRAASDHHAAALGLTFSRLTLRDTRSRWGSCSSQGALMYSWRLILAPASVLDYVAAHEVAHLEEMNHAPAFWAVVARSCPDYAAPRQWLRDHGEELHRYRFEAAPPTGADIAPIH